MKLILAAAFTLSALTFIACNKETSNEQTRFRVYMTDAPLNVDEVNIDLREVQVKYARNDDSTSSNSNNGFVTLQTTAGIYNLLDFQNGLDTMIAQGNIPTNDFVQQIRLIVGDSNTVKVDGNVYDLTIPSGAESGLKIMLHKKMQGSVDSVKIDFDAALSVRKENDGSYKLRPVLQIK